MGEVLAQDQPGYIAVVNAAVASVASNGADTLNQEIGVAPLTGKLKAAYWMVGSASQNTDTTNYRTIKIINNGSLGTGTTVMASLAVTATHAAFKPVPLVLSTVANAVNLTAGQSITYVTVSTSNGVPIVRGNVQLQIG